MKKIFRLLATAVFIFLNSYSFSQVTYYAIATGVWNNPTLWSLTRGGPPAGVVPTANDDVFLDQNTVIVPFATTVRNVWCDDVTVNNLILASNLTINGTLACNTLNKWGFGFAGPSFPTVPGIIVPSGGFLIFTATAVNTADPTLINNEVIAYWSSVSPILSPVVFNFGGVNPGSIGIIGVWNGFVPTYGDIDLANNVTVQSGILTTLQATMTGIRASGPVNTFQINSGARLDLTVPLTQNGTATSMVNTLTVNGILDMTNGITYANSTNFTLGASGSLVTDFYGTNQTEGWWYQSSRSSITVLGSLEYNSVNPQSVYAVSSGYGNLTLSGGNSKTIAGSAALDINGNLTIGSAVALTGTGQAITLAGNLSNNSTFAINDNLIFNGTSNQQISGNETLTINGDMTISDVSRSVSLTTQNLVVNGNFEINSLATFVPGSRNVTLTGNLSANGTLQAGTGSSTFTFGGTTLCTGPGASFNNFTINSTNTFTGPAAGSISVAGNFTNNGTFDDNNGTVAFNGASNQSITETQTIEFNNVQVNNTNNATLSVNGDVDLSGTLTMVSSTARFDADGSGSGVFTLKSNGLSDDARIATLPAPANFTGNVTVERTVNGVSDVNNNWRYLAVPITNANVGMWQATFPVTGNFSNPSTSSPETPITDPSAASIYYWDGSGAPFWYELGSGASTGATSLENGRGYSAYTYRTSEFTVSTRGTIASGAVSKSITANAWALLGNPYPSTIDWNDIYTNNSNIYGSVYIRNVSGSYATYATGAGSGTNHPNTFWAGEISTGQSFWIYSIGATSLGFAESNKTSSGNYQFLRPGEIGDQIRITLSNDIQDDEILIRFAENTIDDFEPENDAFKYRNGDYQSSLGRYTYINLSSYIVDSEEDMAINSIPFIEDCNKTVYLKIQDVTDGEHRLTFTNIEAFQLGYDITLIDNYTDEIIDVTENAEYNFQVTSDSASFGSGRFEVLFVAELINRSYNYYTNSECSEDYVSVAIENSVAGAVYEIYKNGEIIGDPVKAENNQVSMPVSKDLLGVGETLFDLNSSIGSCESFIQDAFIVEYDTIYAITGVEDGTNCGPGQVILQASGAPIDGFYHWYENESDTEPIPNENQAELIIEDLSETRTFYVAAVNSIGCESNLSRAVKGIIAAVPETTPETEEAETTCINSSAVLQASGAPPNGHYVWYDADEKIFDGENESTFETPALSDTSLFYVAVANEQDCAGEKVSIEVPVWVLEIPTITEDKGVLHSSYDTGNQWYKNGEAIQGATGSSYDTELEGGFYTVEYNDDNCAVISDPIEIEGVTGLDDLEVSDLIKLFPNPASDQLYVEYNVPLQEKVRLMIYSSSGRLVDSKYMDIFTNGHKIALDIISYSKGMYITVVYDGENYVYSKFSKQ